MSKKLLIADDSVTIQKVVGITFANEDVEILTETTGAAALERIRANAPDIVLADVSMPEMSGYELCSAIKADASIAHIPVILLTGTFEPYDEERTSQAGADGHIAKPFEAQALVDLVHTMLKRDTTHPPAAGVPEPSGAIPEPAATPLPDLEPAIGPPAPVAEVADQSKVLQPNLVVEPPASGEAVRSLEPPADLMTPASTGDRAESPAPDFSGGETVLHEPPPQVTLAAPPVDPSGAETVFQAPSAVAAPVLESPPVDPMGMDTVVANELPPAAAPVPPEDPMAISGSAGDQPTQFMDPSALGPQTADPDSVPSVSTDSDIFGAPLVDSEPEPFDETPYADTQPESEADDPVVAATSELINPDEVRAALEKVAWDAFGSLSDQVVRDVVTKLEAVAWEVVPALAERLISEEIQKLKNSS